MKKKVTSNVKMGAIGSSWKKALDRDPQSKTFENLESGVYIMALTAAVLDKYGPKQRLGIRFEYTVQEGDSAGCTQSDFSYLDGEDDIYYTQVRLASMNVEIPDNADDLPALLKELAEAKPILRCKVTEKDGFTHVYVNKLIDEQGGETRDEILGTSKAGKDAQPSGGKKVIEPAPEPEQKPAVRRRNGASEEAKSFEEGARVKLVENGETVKGKVVEMCKEKGFVAVEIDEIGEVWEVSIEDNQVELDDEKAAPAKKTLVKKVNKKELPTELAVDVKVSFNDGENDQEGVIVAMNKKAKTCDVKVDEDVYEVPNDACTIVG